MCDIYRKAAHSHATGMYQAVRHQHLTNIVVAINLQFNCCSILKHCHHFVPAAEVMPFQMALLFSVLHYVRHSAKNNRITNRICVHLLRGDFFSVCRCTRVLSLRCISSWCVSNGTTYILKESHYLSTAKNKPAKQHHKFFFFKEKFGSLFCLPSSPLVCLPHVRVGIPAVVCGELPGDYHSLGAAQPVWAQAGVGWQTVVAGVSLLGLKD